MLPITRSGINFRVAFGHGVSSRSGASVQSPALQADKISLQTANAPRFGGPLDKNHAIVLPFDVEMDLDQSLQAQRLLLLKAIEKAGLKDTSHTTVMMDTLQDFSWPASSAAFADAISLAPGKVDTVLQSNGTIETLKPLLSATGKRFIYGNSLLDMGPAKGWYNGTVDVADSRVRLYEETLRNLETLVMARTGKSSRAEVNRDLNSGKCYNALTCLGYGKKGLVDAIIVSHDEVLTRPVLDQYYKQAQPRLDGVKNTQRRDAFNADPKGLKEVVAWARQNGKLQKLAEFSPGSVVSDEKPLYKSATAKEAKGDRKAEKAKKILADPKLMAELAKLLKLSPEALQTNTEKAVKAVDTKNGADEQKPKFFLHTGDKAPESETDLGRRLTLKEKGEVKRLEIAQIPSNIGAGTYMRDSIYFPQAFDIEEGKQMEAALQQLFDKKEQQRKAGLPAQNILLLENSPGGAVVVLNQMRNAINMGSTPVDVMVQGMGASCGAMLLAAATGNRLITPNGIVLLHEVRGGDSLKALSHVTEAAKGMKYMNDEGTAMVAERSGRDLEEVREDFRNDFWTNPVESAVYGPKGLIDGIVVSPEKVIPRQAVFDFIVEKKGSVEAAQAYIDDKFVERRKGKTFGDLANHQEVDQDPLANPLDVIRILVERGKAVSMKDSEQFKASAGDVEGKGKTLDLFFIQPSPPEEDED